MAEHTYGLLIIDDDPSFRHGLRRQLSIMKLGIGFECFEAAHAPAALEILENHRIDCILLDNQMPGTAGLELLSEMLEKDPFQAVIMITGSGNEKIAVDAMKRGAMDYLVKGSVTPENLARAIQNALDKIRMKKTIQDQNEQLLEAERHRVMIESLGAACHHMGQPATVISTYLELMKRQEKSPELQDMIENCLLAAKDMEDVLKRLREITLYRTEPYRPAGPGETPRSDERIVAI